jgi:hypothetical protein
MNGAEETTARQTLKDKDVMMRLNHWLATLAGILAMACGIPSASAQSNPFNTPPANPVQSVVHPITARSQSPAGYPPEGGVVQGGYNVVPAGAMGGDPSYRPMPPDQAYGPAMPGMQPWPQVSPFEHRYSEHRNEGGLWTLRNNDASRKYYGGFGAMLFQMRHPDRGLFGNQSVAVVQGNRPAGRDLITIGTNNFAPIPDSIFTDTFNTEGVRVYWGYWDADDTGLELVGWWASQVTEDFNAFQSFDPNNPPPFVARGYVVPTNNGQIGGAMLFFDGSLKTRYRMSAANGQFTKMLRTIWEWNDMLKVRPSVGARYTFLQEGLFFNGFNYSDTVAPYESTLNTHINSHMAGPEIGIHSEIGAGSFMKVTTGTKFILYINHEVRHLDGSNFIDIASLTGPGAFPFPGAFSDADSATHISPAFEQTVHFEAKVFELVPFLNRMDFFKNAKLRGGLTFLDIGLISRPNKSTKYNSFPLVPTLKTSRSSWNFLAWDVGLHFEY